MIKRGWPCFECTLILTGLAPEHPSANLLLDGLFGAQIIYVPDRSNRDRILNETYDQAIKDGKKPYLVPYGGSSPTGALGYVFAMDELNGQGVEVDWIVFGTSSGGTHAGLVAGQRLFGYKGKVLGISIDESEPWLQAHVSELAALTSERLGERINFSPHEILANDQYCQAGYGVLTNAEREAVSLFARSEGLLLDPVYTGRAAAGLIDMIRKGVFQKSESVLFWHTGGSTALFADRYQNEL